MLHSAKLITTSISHNSLILEIIFPISSAGIEIVAVRFCTVKKTAIGGYR
jgi:hypothetical protein